MAIQTDKNKSGIPFINYEAEKENRPPAFFGVDSAIDDFRAFVPEIDNDTGKYNRNTNGLWLRKRLIKDDNFLTDTVNNLFQEIATDEITEHYKENPEEYKKDFINVKNEIYNTLASEVLSGEDVQTTIKNRQKSLMELDLGVFDDDKIKSTIKNNPKTYEDLDIIVDGEINLSSKALNEKFKNNPEFREAVTEDHFEMFVDQLSKSHNAGGIDTQNIDEMSRAYVAFREFGKEGLTHIVNYEQHYDPNLPEEEQDKKVKDAQNFLRSATHGDKNISEILEEFYGSEESEQGFFKYTPTQESLEMSVENFPRDGNDFTFNFKYNDSLEKSSDALKESVKRFRTEVEPTTIKGFTTSLVDSFVMSHKNANPVNTIAPLGAISTGTLSYLTEQSPRLFYTDESGERTTLPRSIASTVRRNLSKISGFFDSEDSYYDASAQVIADNVRDGTMDHHTRNFIMDVHREAINGDEFTMKDIFDTVMSNARPINTGQERDEYIINLNEEDVSANIALRVLRLSEGNMVRRHESGSNVFIVEPDYYERIHNEKNRQFLENWNTEQRPVLDPDGNIQVVDTPKRSWVSPFIGLTRNVMNLGHGVIDGLIDLVDKSIYKPAQDMAVEYIRNGGDEEGSNVLRFAATQEDIVGGYLDRQGRRREALGENISYGAGHLAAYMWTTFATGGATLSQLGKLKAFNHVKDVKNAKNVEEALNFIKPARNTFLANLAAAGQAGTNLKGVSRGAGTFAKFEIGEMVRQPFTPAEFSLFQLGDISDGMGWTDNAGAITQTYARSNRIGQIGADILANGALSMAFDNIFAATRFASNKLQMKLDPKAKGNSWKIENGAYKRLSASEYNFDQGYSPDMRRFLGNTMEELANMPQGAISETVEKFISSRNIALREGNTLQDVVYLFKDDADDLLGDLYKNVRNTLDEYDGLYTGTRSSDEQLDQRAQQITEDAINNIGDQLGSALTNSTDETLSMRFAQALRNIEPEGEFVTITRNGNKHYDMTLEEAQTIQNQTSNSSIVDIGDDTYRVMQMKETYWTHQIANRIEEIAVHPTKTDKLNQFLRRNGVDDPHTLNQHKLTKVRQLTDEFNTYFNKGIMRDGKQGVVVDIRGDDLIVRFDDTTRRIKKSEVGEMVEPTVSQTELAQEAHRMDLAQKARRQRLKKTDREAWFEQYQKHNKKYKEFLKKKNDEVVQARKKKKMDELKENDSIFKKYGVTKKFANFVGKVADYKRKSSASIRKWIAALGHNGDIDYNNLGINKANIQRFDSKRVKEQGGMPKNVVFSRNVNGKEEHYITIRKTPEDFEPSMYYLSEETGELVLNPYIRRIGKNQTWDGDIPVTYVPFRTKLDGEQVTMYRRAEGDEKGYVLNIQKPMKDTGEFTMEDIFDNNIDGLTYQRNGETVYRPVDEANQVVDLENLKGKRNHNPEIHKPKSVESLTEEQLEQWGEMIARNGNIGKEFARANVAIGPVAGLITDVIEDQLRDDADFDLKFTALFTGLQMGGRYLRNRPRLGGEIRKKAENLFDQTLQPLIRHEQKEKAKRKLGQLGGDDIYSKKEIDQATDFVSLAFDLAKKAKISITNAAMRNKYTQSMFSEMEKMGVESAKELQKVLMNINRTTGDIFSNPERRFMTAKMEHEINRLVEEGMSRQEASKQVRVARDYYEQFQNEIGPEKMKEILTGVRGQQEWSDEYARRMFNASVSRIIESGATIPEHLDKGVREIQNKSLMDVYTNHPMGDDYRLIDQHLFLDPEIQSWVNSHRQWFNDVEDRFLGNLDERFHRLLNDPKHGIRRIDGDNVADIADEYMEFGITEKQFIRTIDENKNLSNRQKKKKIKAFNALRDSPAWDNVNRLVKQRSKYKSFRNEYMPQMYSKDAELRARKNFFNKDENKHLLSETTDVQENAWEKHKIKRFIEVNADKMKLNQLKRRDPETNDLYTQKFNSKDEADQKLKKVIHDLREGDLGDDVDRLLDEARVIKETEMLANGKTKENFIVELPKDLAYGRKGTANQVDIDLYLNNYYKSLNTPNSNHLDNTRTAYIPYELRETNMDSIRHKYSRDTGRRLHNMENNMHDKEELQAYWLDRISRELSEKNPNMEKSTINEYMTNIKSIYRVANGMLGETEATLEQLNRRGFWSSTLRNLQFMRYGYGFGMYNLFEWAVIGSHIGGGMGNMVKTLKNAHFNPTSSDNIEALLSQEHIFRRQIQFARPEFNQMGIYDYGMTDMLAKTNYYSAAGANYMGNFSILGNVLGADMQKAGAFRLLPIVGDSFLGSSMYASAIVSRASLSEASHLAAAAKQLQETTFEEGAPRIIEYKGTRYSKDEISRKLSLLGVYEEDQRSFIEGQQRFNEILQQLDNDPNFNAKLTQMAQNSDKFRKYMESVVNITRSATESYNGINKMFRPEKWDSNLGRVLSMYSTYSFNVSLQSLQRRIKQPLDQFFEQHDGTRISNVMSAAEIGWNIKQGNYQALLDKGMTREAIEAFPLDAVDGVTRLFSSVGVSVAGYMSLAAIRDFIAISLDPNKEYTFEDATALQRELTLNPFAPEAQQVSFADLINEGLELNSFIEMSRYVLNQGTRMGTFGRWGDLAQPGMAYGGMAGLSPVAGEVDKALSTFNTLVNDHVHYFSDDMPNDMKKNIVNYMPFLGSNVFSEARRDWRQRVGDDTTPASSESRMPAIERGVNRGTSRGVNREVQR